MRTMEKLGYIYRPVKIEDYNRVVDTINTIIDKLSDKACKWVDWWVEDVDNIHNYTQLDISLPYDKSVLINDLEWLKMVSMDYNLPKEISNTIFDYLGMNVSVMFNIHFEESPEVKDIIISQWEISLEEFKEDVTPKSGRKKKDGTTKSTRSTTKKNSWASKKRVSKRKS